MSQFDIAVGLDKETANKASRVVYDKLYPGLPFKGQEEVDVAGDIHTIAWDVKQVPTFVFAPPENVDGLVKKLLPEPSALPAEINYDNVVTGFRQVIEDNLFQLKLSEVDITFDDEPLGTFSINIVIQVVTSSGKITLKPIDALLDPPGGSGTAWIVKLVLEKAAEALTGIDIPPIEFEGIELTSPTIAIESERVIAAMNLRGQSPPNIPSMSWPDSPFFTLVSDEAKLKIAEVASNSDDFVDNPSAEDTINAEFWPIEKVRYDVGASLRNIDLENNGSGTTEYNFSIELRESYGEVEITKTECYTWWGSTICPYSLLEGIEIGLKLYGKIEPSGTISISVSDKKVSATVTDINKIKIDIELINTGWDWIDDVINDIANEVLQALINTLLPLIKSAIEGISFEIWTVPNIPIDIEGTHWKLSPKNLNLSSFNGYMTVKGDIDIS
ncbi:MAG: hypothetical protein F6K31_02495 [Symploca sp. SIO2G7]|nr:hypothetical protein [Symploca sp. SIO2G7]